MIRRSVDARCVGLVLSLALALPGAHAALDIGEPVPPFTAAAALGGKTFRYSLPEALAKGPVIVYFFPSADSNACSIEAHAFAEAIDQFTALGASVIGVSADGIDVLQRFSVRSCNSRFPVASDEAMTVIRGFDAVMQTRPDFANRLSYVIAQDAKVAYYYQNLNPERHVERMLAALRTMAKVPSR
jgi:peroxiredoxin Q/BCP